MDNMMIYEAKSRISDETFYMTAERLVINCGIRADLKGYKRFIEAVILYGTETCTGFCELYSLVGKLCGKSHKTVLREMSYALAQSFDVDKKLSAMVGVTIRESDLHVSLVIAYLGRLFRNPDLRLYA